MEAGFTLHGHLYDCCTNKCLVVANVAGVKLNHQVTDAAAVKKPEFLKKSPAGTLPVLETKEGSIFGAVAICRFLSRQNGAKLCGGSEFAHAQVDQWIDFNTTHICPAVCELVEPIYGHKHSTSECTKWANDELRKSLKVVDDHLKNHKFLVGDAQTLADLIVASTLIDVYRLLFNKKTREHFGHVSKWFDEVTKQEAFKSVHGTIHLCDKEWHAQKEEHHEEKKEGGKKKEEKHEKKAEEKPKKDEKPKKEKEGAHEEEEEPKEKAPKNPLDALPPSTFDLYNFKTLFVNAENKQDAMKFFWEHFDNQGYSIWFIHYQKAEGEGVKTFLTVNLSEGFLQKVESLRKYAFAVHGVYGTEPNLEIRGCWVWRGQDHPQDLKEQGSYEYHTFTRADPTKEADRKKVEEYWCHLKEGDIVDGMPVKDVSYFK